MALDLREHGGLMFLCSTGALLRSDAAPDAAGCKSRTAPPIDTRPPAVWDERTAEARHARVAPPPSGTASAARRRPRRRCSGPRWEPGFTPTSRCRRDKRSWATASSAACASCRAIGANATSALGHPGRPGRYRTFMYPPVGYMAPAVRRYAIPPAIMWHIIMRDAP